MRVGPPELVTASARRNASRCDQVSSGRDRASDVRGALASLPLDRQIAPGVDADLLIRNGNVLASRAGRRHLERHLAEAMVEIVAKDLGVVRNEADRHKTESVYRRYVIVAESALREAGARLNALQ
jgi:hypothetical protein